MDRHPEITAHTTAILDEFLSGAIDFDAAAARLEAQRNAGPKPSFRALTVPGRKRAFFKAAMPQPAKDICTAIASAQMKFYKAANKAGKVTCIQAFAQMAEICAYEHKTTGEIAETNDLLLFGFAALSMVADQTPLGRSMTLGLVHLDPEEAKTRPLSVEPETICGIFNRHRLNHLAREFEAMIAPHTLRPMDMPAGGSPPTPTGAAG